MSSLSSTTRPVIQPCSESSCIRLRVRRKVDLPQPDGPIKACTRRGGKARLTPFTAVNLPYIAVSLSVSTRPRTPAGGSADAGPGAGGRVRRAGSPIEGEPTADGEASPDAEDEDDEDEDKGGRPGVAVPLFIGTGCIGEDRKRKGRHRLVYVEAHVLASQRGEQERRGLARDPGDREQAAGHDPRQRRPEHDGQAGAPARI